MIELKNAWEIFKILPKTNCRACRFPTCLAFAAAVFKGDCRLEECPHLEKTALASFSVLNADSRTLEREEENAVRDLQKQVPLVDLASSADRLGGTFSQGVLSLKVLGKDFHVDQYGNVTSDCHVHGWVTIPILNYVLFSAGMVPSGNWVTLRELPGGTGWAPLFSQRCEKPLKRIADTHTDLFEFMIDVFSAERAPRPFDSDIAVILYPLPKVPILLCYWKPDGSMDSSVNVFFDESAKKNLPVEALYRLTAGMVIMFEKISITHGFQT